MWYAGYFLNALISVKLSSQHTAVDGSIVYYTPYIRLTVTSSRANTSNNGS